MLSEPYRVGDCLVIHALAGLVRYNEARHELERLGSPWSFPCAESRMIAECLTTERFDVPTTPALLKMERQVCEAVGDGIPHSEYEARHFIRLVCNAGAEDAAAQTLMWAANHLHDRDRPMTYLVRRVAEAMHLAEHGVPVEHQALKLTAPPEPA